MPIYMNFTRHLAQLRKLWEFPMKGNFPEARRQGGRFSDANSVLFRLRTESYSCGGLCTICSVEWSRPRLSATNLGRPILNHQRAAAPCDSSRVCVVCRRFLCDVGGLSTPSDTTNHFHSSPFAAPLEEIALRWLHRRLQLLRLTRSLEPLSNWLGAHLLRTWRRDGLFPAIPASSILSLSSTGISQSRAARLLPAHNWWVPS